MCMDRNIHYARSYKPVVMGYTDNAIQAVCPRARCASRYIAALRH